MGLFSKNREKKKEKKDRKSKAQEPILEEANAAEEDKEPESLPVTEPVEDEKNDAQDADGAFGESEATVHEDEAECDEDQNEGEDVSDVLDVSDVSDVSDDDDIEDVEDGDVEEVQEDIKEEAAPKKGGFFSKLKDGLKKTRGGLLGNIFRSEDRIDEDFYDELLEALIVADVGMETSEELIESLRAQVKETGVKTIPEAREIMISIMTEAMQPEKAFALEEGRQAVLLIVGVNGVGKTTTIGKLSHYYKESGYSVVLAAADTFRAAAAEQLTEWAERSGVQIIKHGEGADPAAVVFDAMTSYKARGRELLICDTAGRLHNKKNLMDELSKIRRVITRELPDVPVETLLVLDATTGQNAIKQAEAFSEATGLTGLVLTKLDGTAKGGVALAVKGMLGLPIRFVGVGEGIEDMHPFSAEDFARALIE